MNKWAWKYECWYDMNCWMYLVWLCDSKWVFLKYKNAMYEMLHGRLEICKRHVKMLLWIMVKWRICMSHIVNKNCINAIEIGDWTMWHTELT